MKSRRWSPSAMPSRCDLNNCTGRPALMSAKRRASTLIIVPLWYSFGPYTLKNFSPAHCGGSFCAERRAFGHRQVEQMLAPAVEIHRPQLFQRRQRRVVAKPLRAVAIGGGRGGIDERRRIVGAPVEQPQREAEIGLDDEIAVGRRGLRDGAEMDDRIEPAAFQPVREFVGWNDVHELALGQIAPFAVPAEQVAHHHIGAAGVVQRGHDIRSDKTGAAGHQQHTNPCPVYCGASFAPGPAGRQLGLSDVVKGWNPLSEVLYLPAASRYRQGRNGAS